jgi:hypothetical protein
MKEIIEQNQSVYTNVTINKGLNKYDNKILNPQKLERAKEIIAKSGLSSKLEKAKENIKKPGFPQPIEEENSFWVSGTLEQADAHKNTFLITVQSDTKVVKSNFIITTLSETLNDLVKKHWGNMLTVYIKPINGDSKRPKYELLEVKTH